MHTKEPWHVEIDEDAEWAMKWPRIVSDEQEVVGTEGLYSDIETDKANARRIVACVNACAGLETESLENGNYPVDCTPMVNRISSLQQQRDELLAALKDARAIFALAYECAEKKFNDECMLHIGIGGARADAAITKADLTQ